MNKNYTQVIFYLNICKIVSNWTTFYKKIIYML